MLSSTSRPSVRPARRFRPEVEFLETRDCPSGTPMPGTGPTSPPPPPPANLAPTIELQLTHQQGRQVTLHGFVQDEFPTSVIVYFSGAYSGMVCPAGDGSFTVVTDLNNLGTISAYARDNMFASSATVSVTATSLSPVIQSFTATHIGGSTWTVTGFVNDESAAGLTILFGGNVNSICNRTVTVGSNGWFTYTWDLSPGESGVITAQTTDCWGLVSELGEALVNPAA